MKVNHKEILESYKHCGIEYIKGYIQCLYSNNLIKLNEALELTKYFELQEENFFKSRDLSYIKTVVELANKGKLKCQKE